MKLNTITTTEHRLAKAWYVKYPLDAYALGPYRFDEPAKATEAIELALSAFGERPCEVWPTGDADGDVEEVEEYEIQLDVPKD